MKQVKPKNSEKKTTEKHVLENLYNIFEGREEVLDDFNSKVFPLKIEVTGFSGKVTGHSN